MQFTVSAAFKAIDGMTAPFRRMAAGAKASASSMQANFAHAERSLRKLKGGIDGTMDKIFNLRNAAGVLAAGWAVNKSYEMVVGVAAVGDEAAKTGKQLGMSAEALQELRFAADRENVSSELLTNGLKKLNKNVGDLQMNSGALYSMFKDTNPAFVQQLKGVQSNEQAFELLIKQIEKAPNRFQQTAIAQAAFGKAGGDMLKFIDAGSAGIASLREEARKYGGVVSNEAAAAAEEFMDRQTDMNFAITGAKNIIGSQMMPAIQGVFEKTTAWITANRELISVKAKEFVEGLSKTLMFLFNNFETIITVVKTTVIVLGSMFVISKLISLFTMLSTVIGFVKTAFVLYNIAAKASAVWTGVMTAATWLFNAALWANPIMWIVAAIIALIAVVVILVLKWKEITKWFNESSKAVKMLLTPLIIAISPILAIAAAIRKIIEVWKIFKAAFDTGGLVAGLKAIGAELLASLLTPLIFILELLNKVGIGTELTGKVKDFQASLRPANATAAATETTVNNNTTRSDKMNININDNSNGKASYTMPQYIPVTVNKSGGTR